jgi:outer membrane protein assembly factor BamB
MSSLAESTRVVPADSNATNVNRPRYKVWLPVLIVAVYWLAYLGLALLPLSMFVRFLWRLGALGLLVLVFSGWWLTFRAIPWRQRWLVFGLAIAGGAISTLLLHRTVVPPSVWLMAVPALITVWTAWLLAGHRLSDRARRAGLIAILVLIWTPTTLVRMEGLSGEGQPVFHWRWSRSREAEYLASKSDNTPQTHNKSRAITAEDTREASPDDWLAFRGPQRDSVVHRVKIATDWNSSPPSLVWQTRVGPAWSSMAIVGDRLFTQEQRGEAEVVACFDTADGRELWVHEDAGRFEENLSGVGPRSTPTFADGRVYSLGAAGVLNCLNATTGEQVWSRNICTDSGAKPPMWGFSGSPLVTGGLVIVFAGGDDDRGLLAYQADSGEPVWNVAAGHHSYSSPQISLLGGTEQLLFLGDDALTSLEPSTGKILWSYHRDDKFGQPSLQPHVAGDSEVLISFTPDTGTTKLRVWHDAEAWHAEPKWTSKNLKPFFNDFVLHGDSLYGFDGNIFCCIDSQTGQRRWKSGRYGNGQVLLLADQALLLVLSESGEAVLVEANPQKQFELGRFQAIHGKTWNHPVLVKHRLYVRNAEEMACYQLKPL